MKDTIQSILLALYLTAVIVGFIGEVKCIYKAFQCNWEPIGKAECVYTISAITGVGVVTGYLTIEDK
jgi:hypothetical protein